MLGTLRLRQGSEELNNTPAFLLLTKTQSQMRKTTSTRSSFR